MATRQQNAREFVKTWSALNKGREDADRQTFWNDLLQRVYGINNYYDYITYEKDVQVKADGKVTIRRIDGYIASTKVMIEMKGKNIKDLSKPLIQSGGDELTPFEQAKRYANFLPANEYPRWIIVSNFNEIDIHDMNHPLADPTVIKLEDLPTKFKSLEFMVDAHQQQIIDEKQLSVDAGNLVAKIYDSLSDAYAKAADLNDIRIQQSLNMLIVRLVFLMYADDTGILGKESMFQEFLERRTPQDIRQGLSELFKVLNTKEDERDPFLSDEYKQFSYVNGGMFSNEDIVIPQFTPELKDLIVNEAGKGFNWSNISPTIFGAVFESTLNPETRRSGGMHYTSIENIHKVIDPLFLNDLRAEFDHIQNMGNRNQRISAARDFQERLGKLKFFDPACGSGNFLTETYLSLRKMENQLLQIIYGNEPILATEDVVKVKIQNFYGIEINDFAVSVARTAMWIAENQMLEQTKDTVYYNKDFLPLDSNDSIYEGNALRMDWTKIVKPYELNYIMGNPPFIANNGRVASSKGSSSNTMNKQQKEDRKSLFGSKGNVLDYVACWFKKASKFMQSTTIKAAFVSTNSITQGQQAVALWEELFINGITINFAYQSFKWNSEANTAGTVFVVIVGFSYINSDIKILFASNGNVSETNNINAYLKAAPNVFIKKRKKPINSGLTMIRGSQPTDHGNLILSQNEKDKLIKSYPQTVNWIKQFMMGNDFINGKKRFCLWLVNTSPADISKYKEIKKRIQAVKEFRQQSSKAATRKKAETPYLFDEIKNCETDYLAVPIVSSGNRKYIPIGYLSPNVIAGNKLFEVANATLYDFGIVSSIVHMAWTRNTCSWYGPSYSYSNTIVFNNFPWPSVNEKQKQNISDTAQGIFDARKLYPDSSLADLYDPLTMPVELRKAHEANDKAVLKAYGLKPSASEPEIVQHLFKMYEQLVNNQK